MSDYTLQPSQQRRAYSTITTSSTNSKITNELLSNRYTLQMSHLIGRFRRPGLELNIWLHGSIEFLVAQTLIATNGDAHVTYAVEREEPNPWVIANEARITMPLRCRVWPGELSCDSEVQIVRYWDAEMVPGFEPWQLWQGGSQGPTSNILSGLFKPQVQMWSMIAYTSKLGQCLLAGQIRYDSVQNTPKKPERKSRTWQPSDTCSSEPHGLASRHRRQINSLRTIVRSLSYWEIRCSPWSPNLE
jgi:hypothetical protein